MVDYPYLDVAEADWIDQDEFIPRYNIYHFVGSSFQTVDGE